MTWFFVILIAVAIIIILFFVAKSIIGNYFYDIALARNSKYGGFSGNSTLEKKGFQKKRTHDYHKEWLAAQNSKEVSLTSFDGIKLYANIVENTSVKNFVLLCHCYRSSASYMGFSAIKFFEKGYSCILPSARGHDKSEGNYIGMGWFERLDIVKWIEYLNTHYNYPRIVLYGVSMGATTVMNTIGEPLPDNVFCAVEDCGYSSIKLQFDHVLRRMLHIWPKPILWISRNIIKKRTGMDLYEDGDTLKQLKNATIPMLFIHGTEDKFVSIDMQQLCYDAHPGIKQKIIVEGAAHAGCPFDGGEQYWEALFNFITKCSGNDPITNEKKEFDNIILSDNQEEV